MNGRVRAFIIVGALGFGVQLAVLAGAVRLGMPLALATAIAVEAAVLHNFTWHERWTWRHRTPRRGWPMRLLRFHTSNALVSLAVNVALTWTIVRAFHLAPALANALAVGVASLANFTAADRWVFAAPASASTGDRPTPPSTGRAAVALLLAWGLWLPSASPASAQPSEAAVKAWDAYVRAAEARGVMAAEPGGALSDGRCGPDAEPKGDTVRVADGTIYRWHGCTVIRGTTVSSLLDRLIAAGTPPPQEDVVESRLLRRDGDRLTVYLKLIRRTILTVTYDTEHDMVFTRVSPTVATSRSVATRIREVDGGDRGFLWRLQSYWQYRQQGPDVRVDLVSLSLSRDVPMLVRPVAAPLAASVGRESMLRTLGSLRRFLEGEAVSSLPAAAP